MLNRMRPFFFDLATAQERQKSRDATLPYAHKWAVEKHGREFVAEFFAAVKTAERLLKYANLSAL